MIPLERAASGGPPADVPSIDPDRPASVWTKHSNVAKPGRDHPRAFGLGVSRTEPPESLYVEADRLADASVVRMHRRIRRRVPAAHVTRARPPRDRAHVGGTPIKSGSRDHD